MLIKLLKYGLILVFLGCSKSSSKTNIENATDTPMPNDPSSSTFIASLPSNVQDRILWFSDYEDQSLIKWEDAGTFDDFSGGGVFITDESNVEYGIVSDVKNSGSFSSFATIKNVNAPDNRKAVRFMRWTDKAWNDGGEYFPDEAYYSAFFYFPQGYDPAKPADNDPLNDGGWWNIFQFKSENNAGSQAVSSLDLYNSGGKMHIALIIKDYQNDDSEDHVQEFLAQESPLEIPSKKWVYLEVFYKKSKAYDGEVKVWQDGQLLFDKKGVRTLLAQSETAVWGLNNYTDFIVGEDGKNESTIYFDDAIVSEVRIGAHLK